jgi:hypothetical protein
MTKTLPARSDNNPPETVNHWLKLYSTAAAAAGVSMLALVTPAECEVVITKKNIQITAGRPVSIDLNKDGLPDFEFSTTTFRSAQSSHLNVKETVTPLTGGAVVGGPLGAFPGPYASALARGAKIGPSAHFASGEVVIQRLSVYSSGQGRTYGNWSYYAGKNRFLGVEFLIKGETHYGWIRLALGSVPQSVPSSILGYGYETVANKRLSAGVASKNASSTRTEHKILKPGGLPSLGMLALGAEGMTLWRREDTPPS